MWSMWTFLKNKFFKFKEVNIKKLTPSLSW